MERTDLPKPPRDTPDGVPTYQSREVACPYCGSTHVRYRARDPKTGVRYFKCRACDLEGTGGTTFKVPPADKYGSG